ncbi:MAG: [Clostridia bacterium]|nr:[FeFe] hydrogenase H-cluster maturation GTPase HydF [Clostridia bacterium]
MNLNTAPSSERLHIGFFGMRNAGKSSLVNAVTGQALSLVSDVKGTTTDPVRKAMELLPLGPVVIIDTPGLDDEGTLGEMRVEKAKQILATVDIAILVVDALKGMSPQDEELKALFEKRKLPYIIAFNKADLLGSVPDSKKNEIYVSAQKGSGINELKEKMVGLVKDRKSEKKILADLVAKNDVVILVTPIDESAPKGRLILPQQQTIRELLEIGAVTLVVQVNELSGAILRLKDKPKLVITDSQAFKEVSAIVSEDIMLTSFSILFARYKGDLATVVDGAFRLKELRDGDRVLISEGCTHHRQCKDIGTVKLPGWIEKYSDKKLSFSFTSGGEFPSDTGDFALVVHCGGCMLTENEMKNRMEICRLSGTPITNYGTAIAEMHGILKRSLEVFDKKE